MSVLYHSSGNHYEPGDVIHPGNWGRVVLGAGPSHHRWAVEYLLEKVRLEEFPSHPSRIKSAFAFGSGDAARGFFPHLYEITLKDPDTPTIVANMAITDTLSGLRTFHDFDGGDALAREYWLGSDGGVAPPIWETVTLSPLVVVSRVD